MAYLCNIVKSFKRKQFQHIFIKYQKSKQRINIYGMKEL